MWLSGGCKGAGEGFECCGDALSSRLVRDSHFDAASRQLVDEAGAGSAYQSYWNREGGYLRSGFTVEELEMETPSLYKEDVFWSRGRWFLGRNCLQKGRGQRIRRNGEVSRRTAGRWVVAWDDTNLR